MTIPEEIEAVQKKLGLAPDRVPGVKTWTAIYLEICQPTSLSDSIDKVDDRSEVNINTLLPEVRSYARNLIHLAKEQNLDIRVISGTRTFEEQNELFEQGRSKPGKIVTNARGGYSNHNFGIAFDIGYFVQGKYIEESSAYKAVASIGKSIGLTWGGDWQSIQDEPHFELHPNWAKDLSEIEMLANLRHRQAIHQDIFT